MPGWQRSCSDPNPMGLRATVQPAAEMSRTEGIEDWETAIEQAVERLGTPCYVTRVRPIIAALEQLEGDRTDRVRSWLSFKTHPLPPLLRWWVASSRGVEVVSEVEFATARRLGCSVDQLLVNGVAKHDWLIRYPLPRLRVHFDSIGELDVLLPLAVRCGWRVGIRVHVPDERDARDDRFGGQFGMTVAEALTSLRRLAEAGADIQSVHFHLGQRLPDPGAYVRAVEHVAHVCDTAAFRPRFVDCGGGLPARPSAEVLDGLGAAIDLAHATFAPDLEQVWIENGRFVTEDSTALAVRVIDIKERVECRYLICDGGRTNQALAADKGPHPILLLPPRTGVPQLTTICGPTCMTDDTLGRIALPADVAPGDVLAWLNAGAYHLPWETRFSQGLCAVAWYDEAEHLTLARQRERPEQWIDPWNL